MKLLAIDGNSIINRAYYGVPLLSNAEGLHTNGIYGFLNILFKILEEEKPNYLAVAFDVKAPTFRHEMFDGYKGTRKPMADELRQQVPVIKEVLKELNKDFDFFKLLDSVTIARSRRHIEKYYDMNN